MIGEPPHDLFYHIDYKLATFPSKTAITIGSNEDLPWPNSLRPQAQVQVRHLPLDPELSAYSLFTLPVAFINGLLNPDGDSWKIRVSIGAWLPGLGTAGKSLIAGFGCALYWRLYLCTEEKAGGRVPFLLWSRRAH